MPTDKNVDSEMAKCTSQRPSLTINAFSNWTAFFVRGGIAFFLIPAIFAHLGDKRFGMWTLVSSFVGYFGLLRLGVGTGVFRYVPLFRGKNDKSKVSEVISTGMAFYMGVGVLILAVSWVFADSIANFFEGGEELSALIRIIGFAAALECPVLILDAAIRGYEGFYLVNLISILGTVIRAGALFGCIRMDYGLVQMGWVVVIVTLLTLIAQVIAFKIFCKGIESGVRKINVAVLKLLVLYGLIIMVETSATILTFELPKIIVGKVISLETVGYFGGIVCVLIAYYRKFVFGLSHVFFPRFSYLSGRNDTEGTRRLFFRGSRYVSIVSSAVFLLLWSVGPAFLNLWIENDNIQQAFPALITLAAGALVYTTHRISTDLLFGLGKQRQLAVLSMTEGLLVLCLCIMLCPSYGMTGAAVAISLPIILVRGIIQTKLVCRLLAVGFWKYYAECVLTAWLVAFVIAAVCKMVGTFRIVNDWFVLFFTSGLVLILYGVSVYSMALKSEDRREFKVRVFACFNKLAGKRYA